MSDALARVRALNRREVKLEGGLLVGYHLPDIAECLVAGDIPLPALRVDAKSDPKKVAEALSAADVRAGAREQLAFKNRLVAAMLDDLDGVDLTPEDDRAAIVSALTPTQRDELFAIAQREKDPDSGEA